MVILASWSARGNDDGWSSRSQWHSEPKKYFDKSPPPEWDGNHPEKTWRDCRRTLKQRLSTTDVPSERRGMLLWRALTGDAKLLISHFRDEDLLCWGRGYLTPWLKLTSKSASFRTRMTSTMLSTNCTVSATRHCRSLRMWPGLPIGSTTPTVTLCLTGRRAWSSSGKPSESCPQNWLWKRDVDKLASCSEARGIVFAQPTAYRCSQSTGPLLLPSCWDVDCDHGLPEIGVVLPTPCLHRRYSWSRCCHVTWSKRRQSCCHGAPCDIWHVTPACSDGRNKVLHPLILESSDEMRFFASTTHTVDRSR